MIITSSHGVFSIVSCSKDHDKLYLKTRNKKVLFRLFDEKRIRTSGGKDFNFYVTLCKQEFAHVMIMLIKEINYSDFGHNTEEFDISATQIRA